jgi:hypothetical protein
MSDGPDKTLKMTNGWRAFAKAVAKDAYVAVEVCQLLAQALAEDERREAALGLLDALKQEFGDGRQGSFFPDQRTNRLEALRRLGTGVALNNTIVNCAIEVAAEGLGGPGAVREAVKRALLERAQSGARQVETHYQNEAPESEQVNVRRRSTGAIAETDFDGLARRLLGGEPGPRKLRIQKRTGIEEGPPL